MLLFKHLSVQFDIPVLRHDRFTRQTLDLCLILILQPTQLLEIGSFLAFGLLVQNNLRILLKLLAQVFLLLSHAVDHTFVLLILFQRCGSLVQCLTSISTLAEGIVPTVHGEVVALHVLMRVITERLGTCLHSLVKAIAANLLSRRLVVGFLPCQPRGFILLADKFEFSFVGTENDIVTVDE